MDTCVWPQTPSPITLAAGQQLTGVVFPAPCGAWLQTRADDPDHALPQSVSAKGPALLEPELQLIVRGPDGLYRHSRLLANDNNGRDYRAVVPLKTTLALKVASSVADTFDQTGKQVKDKDETDLHPKTPGNLNPVKSHERHSLAFQPLAEASRKTRVLRKLRSQARTKIFAPRRPLFLSHSKSLVSTALPKFQEVRAACAVTLKSGWNSVNGKKPRVTCRHSSQTSQTVRNLPITKNLRIKSDV